MLKIFFYLFIAFSVIYGSISSSYAMDDTYGQVEYDNTTHTIRCICKYTENTTLTNHDTTWDGWQSGILITLVTSCVTVIATDLLNDNSKVLEYCLKPCWKGCLKPCGECLINCCTKWPRYKRCKTDCPTVGCRKSITNFLVSLPCCELCFQDALDHTTEVDHTTEND